MAQVNLFVFERGTTIIHRLDVRIKLLITALGISASLGADPGGLAVLTVLAAAAFPAGKLSARGFTAGLVRFIPFFCIVFLSGVLRAAPTASRTAGIAWLGTILPGGLFQVWVFIVVISFSHVMVSTTSPGGIRGAAEFLLKPVPFVPEKKAAFMLELMLGFFPLLLMKMDEIREAGLSRCSGSRKGFAGRAGYIVLPLLEAVFVLSGEVTDALESRCFSEDVSGSRAKLSAESVVFGLMICALIIPVLLHAV